MKSVILISALFIFGCVNKKQSIPSNSDSLTGGAVDTVKLLDSKRDLSARNDFEPEGKVDIDSILQTKENEYLASFDSGILSLCCYDLLNMTGNLPTSTFRMTKEEYKEDGEVKTVDVFTMDSSFFKTFYNAHPDVERTDLVCGEISSDKIVFDHGIRIGMKKSELLSKIFKPSKMFDKINKLEIYENEMGEAWTTLIFTNERLTRIEFDSDYDWIERSVRK
ncbi:hypothetical protein [Chryseolinea sp. H1M3-3]|uniref:hypothetical protein n=1 Tax=Chryseolinea sp. H1M3-3 TaxID=3034144 RepID=UPI0023EB3F88|nr:hypothetical protein [Chryseolinea sp. H1M3-3]